MLQIFETPTSVRVISERGRAVLTWEGAFCADFSSHGTTVSFSRLFTSNAPIGLIADNVLDQIDCTKADKAIGARILTHAIKRMKKGGAN